MPNRFHLQVCWKGRLAKHLLVKFGVQTLCGIFGESAPTGYEKVLNRQWLLILILLQSLYEWMTVLTCHSCTNLLIVGTKAWLLLLLIVVLFLDFDAIQVHLL